MQNRENMIDDMAQPVVTECDHDERFRGVLGLPGPCRGCLACLAEDQADRIDVLFDLVVAMDGLVFRIATTLAVHLPATDYPISHILDEWNRIKRDIAAEAAQKASR